MLCGGKALANLLPIGSWNTDHTLAETVAFKKGNFQNVSVLILYCYITVTPQI